GQEHRVASTGRYSMGTSRRTRSTAPSARHRSTIGRSGGGRHYLLPNDDARRAVRAASAEAARALVELRQLGNDVLPAVRRLATRGATAGLPAPAGSRPARGSPAPRGVALAGLSGGPPHGRPGRPP